MREVHFEYKANPEIGDLIIEVSTNQLELRGTERFSFTQRVTVKTNESTSNLIKRLEEKISKRTSQSPGLFDTYNGKCNNPDVNRYFGFMPNSTWSGIVGDNAEDLKERKEVDEINKTRHSVVYPVYREFIASLRMS